MINPGPLTTEQLKILKDFWHQEDEINGGLSDASRCILEIERLRAALEDFKTHGLRCDCNPTNGHTWDWSRWQSYLQNADSHVRTRAQIALHSQLQQ